MDVRRLFVHPSEQRLRAPWRLLVHGAVCVCVSLAVALSARLVARGAPGAWWTAQLVSVVLVTLGLGAKLDRRPRWPRALGLDARGALDLAAGAVLGLVLVSGVAAAEVALDVARVRLSTAVVDPWAFAFGLLLFVWIALSEELVFRAYQLTNLAEGLARDPSRSGGPVLAALALASGAFGLAHAGNPNVSVVAVVNVTLAGLLLGVPFALTGRLGFSIGLHFAWNLAQSLLDMPVSGQRVGVALVERTGVADSWLTGGAFGPEGGVLGLGAIALGTLAGVAWARLVTGRLAIAAGLGVPPECALASTAPVASEPASPSAE